MRVQRTSMHLEKAPNKIRTYPDRKKAKFPQNKEIITDRTQILTPAPRPKVIAGQPPTPRHATATTPTPQPHTMDVPRPHECVESETEPTQTEKQQNFHTFGENFLTFQNFQVPHFRWHL